MPDDAAVMLSDTNRAAGGVAPDGAHLQRLSWLDSFRRITTSGTFIPEIDGIRFVAIMLVVVYHVLVIVYNVRGRPVYGVESLARGVQMFYVLSGFVLALPFAGYWLAQTRRVRLKDYFLRRVTRLEPPFLVCLLIYTFLKLLQYPEATPTILRNAAAGSVYLHDALIGRPGMIVSVAWSLEVEVQFYLLMPLLAYVFAIRPAWLRRAIMLAVALLVPLRQPFLLPALEMYNDGHLLNFMQYFLFGMLLADIWVVVWLNAPPKLNPRWFSPADVVSAAALAALLWLPRGHGHLEVLVQAPIIFVMYLSMFHSVWIRRLLRVKVLTVIGGMCYSIYLIHNLVISALGACLGRFLPQSFPVAIALCILVMFPMVLIVSAIYFRLIERPCMRKDWPQRLRRLIGSRMFIEEQPARDG